MSPVFPVVNEYAEVEEQHQEEGQRGRGHEPEPESVRLDVGLVLPQLGVDERHEVPVLVRLGLDLEEPGDVDGH